MVYKTIPLLFILLVAGCATLDADERAELDRMADETITRLSEAHLGLKDELDSSLGYLVVDKKVIKVPIFGGGGGKGVVVENDSGKRTYVKVSRLELGGGWGARNYKAALTITDPKLMKKAQSGTWLYQVGAEASAGKVAVEGSTQQLDSNKGYQLYTLSEGGASATWTLRTIRLKSYRE